MARKRIPSADRRSLILAAARTVFAERGFEGAKTQQIAKAAKVSEALVFRHFPSKLALYRAVLRQLIRDQDANFESLSLPEPNTQSLIFTIEAYFRSCLQRHNTSQAEGTRILFASLAGDGGYARLVYRRAMRLMHQSLERALNAAREAGDLTGPMISAANASLFIDHVGAMITASRLHGAPTIPYAGDDDALLRETVLFCGRGIGLSDKAVRDYFDAAAAPSGEVEVAPAEITTSKKQSPRRAAARG